MQTLRWNFFDHMLWGLVLVQFLDPFLLAVKINPANPQDAAIMRAAKAAEIKSYMDDSVDPCSDFYKFACGNYARINSADSLGISTTGLLEHLSKSINRKLSIMLNGNDGNDTLVDKQVKLFYQSCTRLKLGPKYEEKLRQLISEFGEMPVLEGDAWDESQFNWVDTSARMSHRYGVMPILSIEIMKDFAQNQVNRAYIVQQDFPLESRSMYLDQTTKPYRIAYREKIQSNLEKFLSVKSNLAKQTAQELMDFEVELAYGLLDEGDGQDLTQITELLTVAEIHKRYSPIIDIDSFAYLSLGENLTEPVYEYNSKYQENLVQVLQRTPLRTVANYIFYQLIINFAEVPAKTEKKQKASCIELTKKHFAKNLDNMVYRFFGNTNKTSNDIELLWHQLKATFNQTLSSSPLLNWIEPETRKLSIKKLEALTLQINSYIENNFVAEFSDLDLQDNDYVENLRQVSLLFMRQMREDMHKPAKPLEDGQLFSFTPANILIENTIKVPVALLQPYQLWSEVYPNAILYATLAFLIGHEIMHSFDDMGRKFNLYGNSNDWWDEKSTLNFLERQKCFTNQYAKYVYGNIRLKESISQSENIADNGGLRLAYSAYRNWYNAIAANTQTLKQLVKETLPDLNYTSNQLFFISYAQVWCNDAHSSIRQIQVETDQHVPGKFRVIGPLSNFEEFATEFQCAAGTPMNPHKKCKMY